MWAEERHTKIMTLLKERQRVESEELTRKFSVSRETIRRDLKILENQGLIRRTHGGALFKEPSAETPFRERKMSRVAEKRGLAQAAASLMQAGGSYFVDAGSTTSLMAEYIANLGNVSIITNSIDLALSLRNASSSVDIVLLGGVMVSEVPATFGEIALRQLRNFRADIAFISPVGIDADIGVSYYDLGEAELAGQMLEQAQVSVVIADASKCGIVSRAIVRECAGIDILVTDAAETAAFTLAGLKRVIRTNA